MSTVAEDFHAKFGDPDPEAADGLPPDTVRPFWKRWYPTTKAGWFLDRFLYLFGMGLDRLEPALEAWTEILPAKGPRRTILGHNAHGSILLLNYIDGLDKVGVLDPRRREYFAHHDLNFGSMFGSWLPENRIPGFLDTSAYQAWRKGGEYLNPWEILVGDTRRDIVEFHLEAAGRP